MTNIALQIATAKLVKAQIVLRAHEAAVQMHRDNGNGVAARSAQARVNGLKTAVGKAAFSVRLCEGR